MLEIASEIIICLLLAALIGFALGYLVAKSQSEKSKPLTNTETETKNSAKKEELQIEEPTVAKEPTVEEKPTVVEEPTVEEKPTAAEEPIEEVLVAEETTETEEDIEIPTENAIENALEALESLEDAEEEAETAEEESETGKKPELLSKPRKGEEDDLTDIKGIGPKAKEKLNASGIYHFEQIANWTEENMIWLEAHTDFTSRAKKEAWRTGAKSLLS